MAQHRTGAFNPSSVRRKAACARSLLAISFKLERWIQMSPFKLRLNPSRRLEGDLAPAHTLPPQLGHLPSPAQAKMQFLKLSPLLFLLLLNSSRNPAPSFLTCQEIGPALSFQVRKPFCKCVDVLGTGRWPRNQSVVGRAGLRAICLPAAGSVWKRSRLQTQGGRQTTGIPFISLSQNKM